MADRAFVSLSRRMMPVWLVGGIVIALFFGALGVWASLAPLDSAAIAPGTVAVEGNRKTIQHLEGGIVELIAVQEGEEVDAGQILVQLDKTQPRAALTQLKTRFQAASALQARLVAERDGQDEIAFPYTLIGEDAPPDVEETLRGEINIFAARRRSLEGQAAILEQRVAQFREEIEGLEGQIVAESTQLDLLSEERRAQEALVEKKLNSTERLLALRREEAEIFGNRSRRIAAIARVKQRIAEEKLKILELGTNHINEVVKELRETQTMMLDLTESIRAAQDVLTRTLIRAPLAGTIVNLQIHTVGGVITRGEALMEIVPSGGRLVVQARVDPADIDSVPPGLVAQIRLTSLDQRHLKPLQGSVVSVSADRLPDERTGVPYFLAKIELADQSVNELDDVDLYPGMQAEVMIVTGERTALEYILRPITRSIERALREE